MVATQGPYQCPHHMQAVKHINVDPSCIRALTDNKSKQVKGAHLGVAALFKVHLQQLHGMFVRGKP